MYYISVLLCVCKNDNSLESNHLVATQNMLATTKKKITTRVDLIITLSFIMAIRS